MRPRFLADESRDHSYDGPTDARLNRIHVTDETIVAHMSDGRTIGLSLAWSLRLSDATPAKRLNCEMICSGQGVHWPDMDEDLSVDISVRLSGSGGRQ